MTKDRNSITLAQRLSRFGLEPRKFKNLNVKQGTELHLDPADKRYTERIENLTVKSVQDLKRWIGVPDGAIGQTVPAPSNKDRFISAPNPSFLPFPAVPLEDPEMQCHLMTFLLGPALDKLTPTERQLISQLNKTIRNTGIFISIFFAQDIHIEEGATLVVNPKIQTLFAHAIIIEDNATLKMQSAVSQIDCVRLHFVHS